MSAKDEEGMVAKDASVKDAKAAVARDRENNKVSPIPGNIDGKIRHG